jgi:hypothetical protein
MTDVALARMYYLVKREPLEGTISEATKVHAQACGFVAYVADLTPDQVALAVSSVSLAEVNATA